MNEECLTDSLNDLNVTDFRVLTIIFLDFLAKYSIINHQKTNKLQILKHKIINKMRHIWNSNSWNM